MVWILALSFFFLFFSFRVTVYSTVGPGWLAGCAEDGMKEMGNCVAGWLVELFGCGWHVVGHRTGTPS